MNHSNNTTDYLNQVIEIQSRLGSADFDVESFMQIVVEEMQTLTPATGVVVELIEGNEMVYKAATGSVASHLGLRLDASSSISGLCVRSNKVLRSDDTSKDPRVNAEACQKVGAASLVVAPLVHEGKAVGVLKILSNKTHGFQEKDVKTLQLMAGFIASGLAHQILFESNQKLLHQLAEVMAELQKAQEMLKHMALYDALTDLPNRILLNEKLNSAIAKTKRNKSLMAFMFLDIDHFKKINDTYGHDVGDELLKNFAKRLKNAIRQVDTAARLSGDEFAVLVEDVPSREDVVAIAEKILEKIREKFKLKSQQLDVTTSIGIALHNGENLSATQLIKKADEALYQSKSVGKNRFTLVS